MAWSGPLGRKVLFNQSIRLCLNNPIRFIDPNGKGVYNPTKITEAAEKTVQKVIEENGTTSAQCSKGVREAFKTITGSKELDDRNANSIGKYMAQSDNFEPVAFDQVQELANSGVVVIASQIVEGKNAKGEPLSGHVAMVVPVTPGEEATSKNWGGKVPMVMDTGGNMRDSQQPISNSWGPEKKDIIIYYRYNDPSQQMPEAEPERKVYKLKIDMTI